jgi:RNA polymerase subunit RPABC4/transcription elongation factor Spt4
MANFCPACGVGVEQGASFCPNCGTQLRPEQGVVVQEGSEAGPGQGKQRCPGCQRTTGPAGAICPACGSVYPNPEATRRLNSGCLWTALACFVGLVLMGTDPDSGVLLAVGGTLFLLGGLAGFVLLIPLAEAQGRFGPAGASPSCCGCSCVVALIALPTVALVLWSTSGPLVAALVIPAWVPIVRGMDATLALLGAAGRARGRWRGPSPSRSSLRRTPTKAAGLM